MVDIDTIPRDDDAMFSAHGIETGYGDLQVLFGVDVEVHENEIVLVFGPNGAGKSTFMRAIYNMLPLWSGRIEMGGDDLSTLEGNEMIERGVAYVPQSQNVFPNLTISENLDIGSIYSREDDKRRQKMYDLFPRLEERKNQNASTLSGGESQMLAMARALMPNPDLLLIDEPSAGLAPQLIDRMFEHVERVRDAGTAVLMIEQNVMPALEMADRGYVLDQGETRFEGPADTLRDSSRIRDLYLGRE